MTVKVTIENASDSAHAVMIDKGDMVHLALRPGESTEQHVWEGSYIRITELSNLDRSDLVWLTERAMNGPSGVG